MACQRKWEWHDSASGNGMPASGAPLQSALRGGDGGERADGEGDEGEGDEMEEGDDDGAADGSSLSAPVLREVCSLVGPSPAVLSQLELPLTAQRHPYACAAQTPAGGMHA